MRRVLFSLLISLLWLGSLSAAALAQAAGAKGADISGAWILIELFPDETHTHRMSLQVADNKITGQSGQSKMVDAGWSRRRDVYRQGARWRSERRR
jgi:hypothetical protein